MPEIKDSLINPFVRIGDSLCHYQMRPFEITDTLPVYFTHQAPAHEIYGRFSTVLAPVKNENRLSHLVNIPTWEGWATFGILLIFFLFFRYIITFFQDGLRSLLSLRLLQKRYKENAIMMRNTRQVLLIFSAMVFAFWVFPLLSPLLPNLPYGKEILYTATLFAILAFLFLRLVLLRLIGVVSASSDVFSVLNYSRQLYIIAAGILLFPLSVIFLLNSDDIQTGINITAGAVCSLAVVLYIVRSFQIFYSAKFSIFFWILYLCTFEIAPLLVLYGFLIAN